MLVMQNVEDAFSNQNDFPEFLFNIWTVL